jgi:hypothetical protein
MTLDIRTLFVCNLFLSLLVAFALFFYKCQRKTYDGYSFWLAGSLMASLGHLFILSRAVAPLWISIFLTNVAFILSGVLRLDGAYRFMRGEPLRRTFYLLPAVVGTLTLVFYINYDSISLRNAITSVGILLICLEIYSDFMSFQPKGGKCIYRIAAVLNLIFGLAAIARSGLWLARPETGIFDSGNYQGPFLIMVILYEAGWGFLFLIMNAQRLEVELEGSHIELNATIARLEKANSEVKVLSGMLPICAACKKIRDDRGYWNQIESYIHVHSEASFSHGICPDCATSLYPELYPQDE